MVRTILPIVIIVLLFLNFNTRMLKTECGSRKKLLRLWMYIRKFFYIEKGGL